MEFHDSLISAQEAAKYLGGLHIKTLQRMARQNKIPGYFIAGRWRFRRSELDVWLSNSLLARIGAADS